MVSFREIYAESRGEKNSFYNMGELSAQIGTALRKNLYHLKIVVAGGCEDLKNQPLKRIARAEGLRRLELAARTDNDFYGLTDMYDKLNANRERKERYWEKADLKRYAKYAIGDETVFPRPIDHIWWRKQLAGDFIDTAYDCPHEIAELVGSASIYAPLSAFDENRREILYYRVIRQWSPQKLAAYRGQTDRNIRKVYDATITTIRNRLYERLEPRYKAKLPLTYAQREFCRNYEAALNGGKGGGDT